MRNSPYVSQKAGNNLKEVLNGKMMVMVMVRQFKGPGKVYICIWEGLAVL